VSATAATWAGSDDGVGYARVVRAAVENGSTVGQVGGRNSVRRWATRRGLVVGEGNENGIGERIGRTRNSDVNSDYHFRGFPEFVNLKRNCLTSSTTEDGGDRRAVYAILRVIRSAKSTLIGYALDFEERREFEVERYHRRSRIIVSG